MRTQVLGRTGTTVLSDDTIQYKLEKRRTVRYWYERVKDGWICCVVGPFHSKLYGATGFGTKRKTAKAALQRNLANNYGYIGNLLFSDVDESDTVGIVDERLLDARATARPITNHELVGTAGR